MEEVVKTVKEFLMRSGVEVEVKEEGNKTAIIPNEPIELEFDEYYTNLYDYLKRMGFYPTNGAEYILANYIKYKSFEGVDEFESDDRTDILIYYTKVLTQNKASIFIRRVEIEFPEE